MKNLKKETVDILLETYNDGMIKGLEIAQDSLVEFLRIKESQYNLAPSMSITELSLFMKTTIESYKNSLNKSK